MAKTFYRYTDDWDEDGIVSGIWEHRYTEVSETPCGYWVIPEYRYGNKQKWVSKTAIRRLCYPTKKEALNSYIKRKEYQSRMCEHLIRSAVDFIELANDALKKEEPNS